MAGQPLNLSSPFQLLCGEDRDAITGNFTIVERIVERFGRVVTIIFQSTNPARARRFLILDRILETPQPVIVEPEEGHEGRLYELRLFNPPRHNLPRTIEWVLRFESLEDLERVRTLINLPIPADPFEDLNAPRPDDNGSTSGSSLASPGTSSRTESTEPELAQAEDTGPSTEESDGDGENNLPGPGRNQPGGSGSLSGDDRMA